jgi:Family of unknown function (DUF5675)
MIELHVTRKWFTSTSTCGMLDINGVFFCYTLERQRFQPGMAKPYAIPDGLYPVLLLKSPHFEMEVPHVQNVEGFTGIEIHPANFPSDLLGCCGVGSSHYENYIDPKTGIAGGAVFGSRPCFAGLMEKLKGDFGAITITYSEEAAASG